MRQITPANPRFVNFYILNICFYVNFNDKQNNTQ